MTDNELGDLLTEATKKALYGRLWGQPNAPTVARMVISAVLPLVRAEIAAAEQRGERRGEQRGAERAAQAIRSAPLAWHGVIGLDYAATLAREAVPAPTGDNA